MQRTNDENDTVSTLEPPASTTPANAATPAPATEPLPLNWDDGAEDEPSGFKKWGGPIIVGILTIATIAYATKLLSKKDNSPAPQQQTTVRIQMAPPPPPPPPPPPVDAPKEAKMIAEEKQDEAPPDPGPQISTTIKGPGPSSGIVLGNSGGPAVVRPRIDQERARWSAYARQVQARISQVLRENPRTRMGSFRVDVRIWADPVGRVTRAALAGSTGDAATDEAITNQVLMNRQLPEAPPQGMPMPIVMRFTAQRPAR
jgi:TonB family protein